MTHEEIAKVCHQANKAYCEALGDKTHLEWDQVPEELKTSVIEGVKSKAKHHQIAAAQMHNLWMRKKAEDGWTYGAEKSLEKKTHPSLLPYRQLPVEQRIKDELFLAVAGTLLKAR